MERRTQHRTPGQSSAGVAARSGGTLGVPGTGTIKYNYMGNVRRKDMGTICRGASASLWSAGVGNGGGGRAWRGVRAAAASTRRSSAALSSLMTRRSCCVTSFRGSCVCACTPGLWDFIVSGFTGSCLCARTPGLRPHLGYDLTDNGLSEAYPPPPARVPDSPKLRWLKMSYPGFET